MDRKRTIEQLESLRIYYKENFGKKLDNPDEDYEIFKEDLEAIESAIALLEADEKKV
jgi:hypothetical protein